MEFPKVPVPEEGPDRSGNIDGRLVCSFIGRCLLRYSLHVHEIFNLLGLRRRAFFVLLHVSYIVGLDSERLVADVTLVPLLFLKLVGSHVRPQAREVQKSLQMITASYTHSSFCRLQKSLRSPGKS